jgi:lysozyme
MDILCERIKKHEKLIEEIYLDSKGNPTGGYGHHFYVGSPVPKEVADIYLKADIERAIADFRRLRRVLGSPIINRLDTVRRRVIVEMLFNMGLIKVIGFRQMWGCIGRGDWPGASREMLWNGGEGVQKTKWYQDVKGRAEFLASIMETGIDPEYHNKGEKS